MAIQYVTYQDTRSNGNNMWYGRAVHPTTVTLSTLAERVQRNCSMTEGDVLAVIKELLNVMQDELQNSNKVQLDGLGTFYVGVACKPAATEEDFSAQNIKRFNVRFLAQGRKQNGVMVRTFTDGIKAQKASGATK